MPPQYEPESASSDGATTTTAELSDSDNNDDGASSSFSDPDDASKGSMNEQESGRGGRPRRRRAGVAFDRRVRVREHNLILGDHPRSALPLALDWASAPDRLADIDYKRHSRRGRYAAPRHLSGAARRRRLLEVNDLYDDARHRAALERLLRDAWEAVYVAGLDSPMDATAAWPPDAPPPPLRRSASCCDVPRVVIRGGATGQEAGPPDGTVPMVDPALDRPWHFQSTRNTPMV